MIAGLVNADGPGFSGTWYLYLHQGAWITWGPSKDGAMDVWASVPVKSAPIRCGKPFTGDASAHLSVPLPQGTQSVAVFQIAPFCLQDVASFYTTTLTAAGWTPNGPFQMASASGTGVTTASAFFARSGVSIYLSLNGAEGTPTVISVT